MRCRIKFADKYDRWECYRGLKVDPRWAVYENFLEDMGECPPDYQLDRINNNRGYEPGNCRWVTREQNVRNRTDNRPLKHPITGEVLLLKDWERRLGLGYTTLYYRLKRGWPLERALAA
jgi:hypothetical protein